jgi:hypothetical protein
MGYEWTNERVTEDSERYEGIKRDVDAMEMARLSNHRRGLPWTSPLTGLTVTPPAPRKARKAKSAKRRGRSK